MSERNIKEKAKYCLNCRTKPCSVGCPLENDIPEFITKVKNEEYEEAYKILSKTTVLQPICGTICPHMSQCQGSCVRRFKGEPTAIGELEAYIGRKALEEDYKYSDEEVEIKDKSIAVIGGGPSGLTCAAFLRRKGYNVTIFEKHDKLGGILSHGIPDFRLDRDVLNKAISKIVDLGVSVEYNKSLGKDFSLKELKEKYDAIFLGVGANIPTKMKIDGEEFKGVYGGNSLLEENLHPDYTGKNVAVIGGGNVAMDCSRTIKRLGAKNVYVIYRRAEEQMPAERKEIEEAKEEGVEFLFQNNIVKIFANDQGLVNSVECIKTQLVQKEGDLRPSPVDMEGSNYNLEIDYVVMAIGSKPENNIIERLGINLTNRGYIEVDKNYMTSQQGVFAGGDIIGQKATVAWAARAGRKAAEEIDKYLSN